MDFQWKDITIGIGGFLGGLLASLLKAVMPTYTDLTKENRDLRTENGELREKIAGLEDTIRDNEER